MSDTRDDTWRWDAIKQMRHAERCRELDAKMMSDGDYAMRYHWCNMRRDDVIWHAATPNRAAMTTTRVLSRWRDAVRHADYLRDATFMRCKEPSRAMPQMSCAMPRHAPDVRRDTQRRGEAEEREREKRGGRRAQAMSDDAIYEARCLRRRWH